MRITRTKVSRKSDSFGFRQKGTGRTQVRILGTWVGPYKGKGSSAGQYSRAKKR